MAIDIELRERAREMYVVDGLTLEQVAKETGISEATVMRWSADEKWPEKKQEYRRTLSAIKRDSLKLKKNLISKALHSLENVDSIDPQDMHGFRAVLAATIIKESEGTSQVPDIDRPRLFLESLEFVAEVLREIDPEGLKIFARSFEEVVRRFKESLAADKR